MKSKRSVIAALAACVLGVSYSTIGSAQQVAAGPLITPKSIVKVSEHVLVIPDEGRRYVPNVGFVIGERAGLVIDPGLGFANGEIVLAEARKLAKGKPLYVVATHHHPEHDLGAGAFPSSVPMIRSRDQQRDVDEFGLSLAENFARRSPDLAALISGGTDRRADILFDDEYTLDLGGVTVRMYAAGPAHTRGDTLFYVEQDRVLFAGDIAQRRAPLLRSPTPSVGAWMSSLEQVRRFDFKILVPSHGPMGDASTVGATERYLQTVQRRTRELKAKGMSVDQIAAQLLPEIKPVFAEWPNLSAETIAEAVKPAYAGAR